MSENELKIWFRNKYNSCYFYENKIDGMIDMIFDKQVYRQMKLQRILGHKIEYPSEIRGKCYFKIDKRYEIIWCDYIEIWSFFQNNYCASNTIFNNYYQIHLFISYASYSPKCF